MQTIEQAIEQISKLLYIADPVFTMCKENELTHEYDWEAEQMVLLYLEWKFGRYTKFTSIDEIPSHVFDYSFGSWSVSAIKAVTEQIVNVLKELPV